MYSLPNNFIFLLNQLFFKYSSNPENDKNFMYAGLLLFSPFSPKNFFSVVPRSLILSYHALAFYSFIKNKRQHIFLIKNIHVAFFSSSSSKVSEKKSGLNNSRINCAVKVAFSFSKDVEPLDFRFSLRSGRTFTQRCFWLFVASLTSTNAHDSPL